MAAGQHTLTIRDARAADLPRLLELLHQLSQQSRTPEATARLATDAHRETLRNIAADPRVRLVVAEDGDRVVGTLTLYLLPNLSHGARPFAIVENVVVDADARGAGYGRALMEHAVRLAREAGCYKVSLTSHNNRAEAHAFYSAIGFTNSHRGFTLYSDEDRPSPRDPLSQ